MRLKDLEGFDPIVIQCHDNPDADALASGFGLYRYFSSIGKKVRFVYSGRFPIRKSNLVLMLNELQIPVEYVKELDMPELLVMTDCQYAAGNVTRFEAKNIAVIDHHQADPGALLGDDNRTKTEAEKQKCTERLTDIRSRYGSCSTIVWQMLLEEGYAVDQDILLSTALYYGLYMDTGQLGDIYHPVDKDMRDSLNFDKAVITKLKNSNISRKELEIAGDALIHNRLIEDMHFAIVKVKPCDLNILGIVSDFVLQTDVVNTCVIYSPLNDGYKLSFRSCDKEIKASDLAGFITEGIGSGGGHTEKAGGFISQAALEAKYPDTELEDYFIQRMEAYLRSYQVVYAGSYELTVSDMKKYRKKRLPLGYLKLTDVFAAGTPILVRTLEGDLEILAQEDTLLMIGIQGEVYPMKTEKFARSYQKSDEPYTIETEYIPSVHNRADGTVRNVTAYAKSCIPTGETVIYAKPIDTQMKIFTAWDRVNYMSGRAGDYIAARQDDLHDIYIIEQSIFAKTYEICE